MKFHSFLCDLLIFLLILCFLIYPVIVSLLQSVQAFLEWNFPVSQLILALFSAFIYFFYKEETDDNNKNNQKNLTIFFLTKLFPGLFSLCLLFFSALLLKGISCVVNNPFWNGNQSAILPETPKEYFFCILSFVFAAFYEESIYRFYVPEIINSFILKKINSRTAKILSEIIALLLFSVAHLYLGGFAVINAIFGHCVLRLCFIKSKSIWSGTCAHFIYNLLVLFLL